VTGFVSVIEEGDKLAPIPLDQEEVKTIIRQMESGAPRVKVGFTKGESVRIIDGPFTDFIGVVDEINLQKGKVRVLVSLFGRETPIEVDFVQVERL